MKIINPISATTLLYLLFSLTAISQTETKMGGFLAYDIEIKNIGIGAHTEFPIIDKLTTSPSFKYYIPKYKSSIKPTWYKVNGYANYYLLEKDKKSLSSITEIKYMLIEEGQLVTTASVKFNI